MIPKVINVNALKVMQKRDLPIFVFGIEGRLIHQIATISYANRSKDGTLTGYQRGAVAQHISEILDYLSRPESLLPNAIVVAFDDTVIFSELFPGEASEWGAFGKLTIPLAANLAAPKAGWIVDGQQRATALSKLPPGRPFPVVVVGFKSSEPAIQREQFLLVNKTKPLPRDLLNEILPEIETHLPRNLKKRQLASSVVKKLRFDVDSPFYGRIRGLGSDEEEGASISQAAIMAVVENSIKKKGVLYYYFGSNGKRSNITAMAKVVSVFFDGVQRTWPEEWNGSPKTSRLVHGVGIVALGHLMDRIMAEVDAGSPRAASMVEQRLDRIKRRCAWSSGRWPAINRMWNELQNTSQDKTLLTDHLLREYDAKS